MPKHIDELGTTEYLELLKPTFMKMERTDLALRFGKLAKRHWQIANGIKDPERRFDKLRHEIAGEIFSGLAQTYYETSELKG